MPSLPMFVRNAARNFALLKSDPKHPSLHFKCIRGDLWSARVGRKYRAVAVKGEDRFQWFWTGTHPAYRMDAPTPRHANIAATQGSGT